MRLATITVPLAGQRPGEMSLDNLPNAFAHGGKVFSRSELAIVGAALNAKLFYTEEFEAACRQAWMDAHPVVDTCITANHGVNWEQAPDSPLQRKPRLEALEAELASAPRGTWALLRYQCQSEGRPATAYTALIATGGGVHRWGQSYRAVEPTHDQVVQACVGREIYDARRAEEHRRNLIEAAQTVSREGWRVGSRIKAPTIGGGRFSSGVVESIEDGSLITLTLTKRGTRKQWTWTGLAHRIGWEPAVSVHYSEVA